jgi:hypothetical protein
VARRGDVLLVSYYWRLEAPAEGDLQATVLFTDGDENVQLRRGFPLWWESHELGGGLYPTSQWDVGQIVKEEYYVLVPRTVEPGSYHARIRVYGEASEAATSAVGDEAPGQAHLVDRAILVE